MGFSSIVSQIMLFTFLMIIVLVLTVAYKAYISTTNNSLEIQQEKVIQKIGTSFSILNVSYSSLDGELSVYLKNTGSLSLDPKFTDLMVDDIRFPRNSSGREVQILNSTNLINPLMWDPGEKLKVNASVSLASGEHLVRVIVENGVVRSAILTVP